MSEIPTREELKQKYGITNDDFEVLQSVPDPREVHARGSFLVQVGELFGAPVWLWKTFAGAVLGVILVFNAARHDFEDARPVLAYGYERMADFVQYEASHRHHADPRFVVFTPPDLGAAQRVHVQYPAAPPPAPRQIPLNVVISGNGTTGMMMASGSGWVLPPEV